MKKPFPLRGILRVFFLSGALACTCLLAHGQFGQPHPVDLVIKVFIGDMTQHAPGGVSVQLLDMYGVPQTEQRTDNSGRVEFTVLSGDYTVRIYGVGIQEYSQSLEIDPVETRKTENIVLHAKSTISANIPGGAIPVTRLQAPAKAQAEFQKGSAAMGKKDWAEAKKRFDAAIAIYPDYDVAYNGLGDVCMANKDMAGARTAFEKAISLNKDFAEPYRNLALVSFSEHKYDEADDLLTKSLNLEPDNVRALVFAANAELLTHKYDAAVANAHKAHALPHPGMAGVHIVAARALEADQKPEDAAKEYQLYLTEDPQGRDAAMAHDAVTRLQSAAPAAK